jgi:hypothetical protein
MPECRATLPSVEVVVDPCGEDRYDFEYKRFELHSNVRPICSIWLVGAGRFDSRTRGPMVEIPGFANEAPGGRLGEVCIVYKIDYTASFGRRAKRLHLCDSIGRGGAI